jgi:imidazolonepropionase-like amidohydrolase
MDTALQAEQPAPLVIEGGTLIDGNGGEPIPDALIVIQGNRIESVSRERQASYAAGAQVLKADGKFILPGLINAHVHYSGFLAELMLCHGVTSVFDIGGRGPLHRVRRDAIARGRVLGPRLFVVVESLLGPVKPGRVAYTRERGRQDKPLTMEEARAVVKRAVAGGADLINIRRGLSQEVFQEAVAEAHRAGLAVVAQPIGPTVFGREAVLAGADVLEHAAGINISIAKDPSKWRGWGEIELHSLDPRPFADMDEGKAEELIGQMVARNTYLEPDLIAQGRGLHEQRNEWKKQDVELLQNPELGYIPEGTRHKWMSNYTEFDAWEPAEREQLRKGFHNMQRFIGQFARAGGKLMSGTDTSAHGWAVAGIGLHRELELLTQVGLTSMEAILAATRNTAEGYRVLDRLGTVEAGKLADLVIVNADPLRDIRNLQKIEWVIKDGKVIDRSYHRGFADPFEGAGVDASEWVEALKRATMEGLRTVAGLTDPTWAFGQPCPGIESISPIVVTEGGSAFTLTIKGVNFTKKSAVYLGGRPIPTELVNETELRAAIDAESIARAGTSPVVVKNPGPHLSQPHWGSTSNRAYLTVGLK